MNQKLKMQKRQSGGWGWLEAGRGRVRGWGMVLGMGDVNQELRYC